MARNDDIEDILERWPFDPESVNVREIEAEDGRDLLQMRIDLGILQLETKGRPDGERPYGAETILDYILGQVVKHGDEFEMGEEECDEVDREFIQYYHRRICWLKLARYDRAVEDADHTLALMDVCDQHATDEQWTSSHEQYRPFVIFHRTQAAALDALEQGGADAAVAAINGGLDTLRELFVEQEIEEYFEENELVARLIEFRESLRDEFEVGQTLQEQLADAVASEEYELAARLRDEIRKRADMH